MKEFKSTCKLHVFICVNEKENKPSCSPKISTETFREIKQWLITEKLVQDIYCNRTHCLGFCNPDGGVMVIYPQGKYFIGIQSIEEIKEIIIAEYTKISN